MKIILLHSIKILLVISILSSCENIKDDKQHTSSEKSDTKGANEELILTKEQLKSSDFSMGKLEEKPFYKTVRANGVVDLPPEQHVNIAILFDGFIYNINFLEGQAVKKNQTLFTLENPDYILYQKEYLGIKEELIYLKAEYLRHSKLAKQNISSQKQLLKAKTEYTVASINLKAAEKKLVMMGLDPSKVTPDNLTSSIVVKSPLSGYVTEVNVHKGMFVSQSTSAMVIINKEHIHLELNIFEKDLSMVKIHQDIKFWVQNDSQIKYDAEVHLINKVVNQETRTVNVHAHLKDEGQISKFQVGMYVTAAIIINSKKRLSLPEVAIVDMDSEHFVLVKNNDNNAYPISFRKVNVAIGLKSEGYVEIINPKPLINKTILTKGAFHILKGEESGHSH